MQKPERRRVDGQNPDKTIKRIRLNGISKAEGKIKRDFSFGFSFLIPEKRNRKRKKGNGRGKTGEKGVR